MRLTLIALLLLLSACGKENAGQKLDAGPPASVTVITLSPEPWQDSIEAVGTIKARESVVISAKQAERVATVRFESGQRVAKGQVLIELDAGTVKAELAEVRANLADLDAQVTRLQSLQGRQLIAQSQLDTVVASRNAARARMQAASERLNDRIIRAPFSGVLGLRQVSQGQYVNAGFAMVNLDDLDHMWVDFPVPESLLSKLKIGMTLNLEADAFPNHNFNASVASIDSRVDIATRAIMVRAGIENTKGLVRPGMLMRVSLQQNVVESLVVPELAVQQIGNRSFVFVANADGTAISQDVRIGTRRAGKATVIEGLKAGDKVVVEGTSKLRDGQKIKIVAPNAQASPTP
jgi:membrane fusion protein, multidrug efflux system